jgi:Amt family ammonium transporter
VFVDAGLGGAGLGEDITMIAQVGKQFVGVVVTIVYCGLVSFIVLKGLDMTIGLRVMDEEEELGLDLVSHDEQAYNIGP